MKIYNEVRINIDTLETVYEDSFEYDGPVAMCGGSGGGSDSEVVYQQSPAEAQIYKKAYPVVKSVWRQSGSEFADNLDLQKYMLPTQGWYDGVSREMRSAMWEPYNEGANYLKEAMGAQGTYGSPRGGYSGAAGAALGEYYSNATNDIALNTWNMGTGYRNAYYASQMFPYSSALNAIGGTYGNAIVDPGTANMTGANVLSGAIGGGTLGWTIGSSMGGAAGGAGAGMGTGASAGSSAGPWGAAIGAVAGGLLGWLGS